MRINLFKGLLDPNSALETYLQVKFDSSLMTASMTQTTLMPTRYQQTITQNAGIVTTNKGFNANTKFYFCSSISSGGLADQLECTLESFSFWFTYFSGLDGVRTIMLGIARKKSC